MLNWKTCLFYLYDITVFSKTWEEHLQKLEGVFECLRKAKLKLGASKCTLAAREVSYLGNRVTRDGLLLEQSLLPAIREIAALQNVKELGSFLELSSFYWQYVKGFTVIALPLHALMKRDAVYHWAPECQDAFIQLKHLLTTAPITAFHDFDLPFWPI